MTKILVIEDDEMIRTNMCELLEAEGFIVENASDGHAGVEKALEVMPDIILCDVMMPLMDGFSVLRRIREVPEFSTTPFIFLTARADKANIRQGMESGADDYLTKPFTREELLRSIDTRLEKYNAHRRQSERQMDDLRSNISMSLPHEFLTPLTGIMGAASMLISRNSFLGPEEVKENAGIIYKSAERLQKLIQNFIFYTRLELIASSEAEIAKMQRRSMPSAEMTIMTIIQKKTFSSDRQNDISAEVEDAPLGIDEQHFAKILEELLDNAMKFSDQGTPIRILAGSRDGFYEVTITDNGYGMTQEQIGQIGAYMQFDRKEQEQQGPGLGLSIAKKLCEIHQGSFEISSVPDEFTTVRLTLPLKN